MYEAERRAKATTRISVSKDAEGNPIIRSDFIAAQVRADVCSVRDTLFFIIFFGFFVGVPWCMGALDIITHMSGVRK